MILKFNYNNGMFFYTKNKSVNIDEEYISNKGITATKHRVVNQVRKVVADSPYRKHNFDIIVNMASNNVSVSGPIEMDSDKLIEIHYYFKDKLIGVSR